MHFLQPNRKKKQPGLSKSRIILAGLLALVMMFSNLMLPIGAEQVQEQNVYRLYNPNGGEHFYTLEEHEKNALVGFGWIYEGIGWIAPVKGDPVYRLYNPNGGDHHYTLSVHERDALQGFGWKYEGICWYSDPEKHVPVYREYNPNAKTGAHNFTVSLHEHEYLCKVGWHDEGIAWYALKNPPAPDTSLKALHVSGTRLLDENNQPVILQGYSTFGLNYMPQFVNENTFRFLKEQMGSQIIRLAMYTQEPGGYCSGGNQQQLKALVDKGVQAAEKTGQYCIIDWHILSDGDPFTHLDQARSFFDEMAGKYASKKHVLYEICNEPNGVNWQRIKDYAAQIIPVIRAKDPDAVILVGTPTWSQDVDTAADDPIRNQSNIMYTLHFYAATHKDSIRSKLRTAHAKGLPVFVSEFGISSADGNGALDPASGDAWIRLLNEYGISRVGWALSDKNESSAIFLPGADPDHLSLSSLSAEGKWFHQTYTDGKTVPEQPDPGPDQPANPKPVQVKVQKTNSWTEGSDSASQFSLTVVNPNQEAVENWQVQIRFSQTFSVENSWNCQYEIHGSSLTVKPVDWNAEIPAGGSQENIGLILKSTEPLEVLE